MPNNIDLNLCIYHINSLARYRLSSSVPPHEIIEWRGPGPQPTQTELEAAWTIVSDPDWLDPLNPDYDWLVWKRETLGTPPPYSLPDLWDIVMAMLERMEA